METYLDFKPEDLYPLHIGWHNEKMRSFIEADVAHRLTVLKEWGRIAPGSKVVDFGCGVGDFTALLAMAVGEGGHVTGVDGGPPDYGKPITLAEGQEFLSKGPLGPRISWARGTASEFLRSTNENYDVAVFSHSIWYFASPDELRDTLTLLSKRVKRIFVVEWSLTASRIDQVPHVLASLALASVDRHQTNTGPISNVRTILSPAAIKDIASKAGYSVERESTFVPAEDLHYGWGEVNHITKVSRVFEEPFANIQDPREKASIRAIRDAVESSKAHLPGGDLKKTRCMDAFTVVFLAN